MEPAVGWRWQSFDGSTANGLLTYKDTDEATVESNLTFDGSTLFQLQEILFVILPLRLIQL